MKEQWIIQSILQDRISLVMNATNENSLSRSRKYRTPHCHSTVVMLYTSVHKNGLQYAGHRGKCRRYQYKLWSIWYPLGLLLVTLQEVHRYFLFCAVCPQPIRQMCHWEFQLLPIQIYMSASVDFWSAFIIALFEYFLGNR